MRTLERSVDASPGPPGSMRPARRVLLAVLAAVAGMWILSTVGLLIYSGGFRAATERDLLIPYGTSELIAAGQNPLDIPPEWEFVAGDTLNLVNEDVADHWIGSWFVPAGDRTSVELYPAYAGLLTCSIHPSGNIEITVEPSGFDWGLTAFPALVIGIPLGLIGAAVSRVMSALKREDGPGA